MKILSIETSCDDTGISILEAKGGIKNASFKVLADNVSSQIDIHIPYGGVFPALAKREHIKNLPIVLEKTLKQAKLEGTKKPVDLIAVTYGPGLEPALWTGITFAQELSQKWKVPVVPVNHMEGHILSVFGKKKGKFKVAQIKYPALSLLVSGGHTEIVLVNKSLDYKVIGQTLDDAVGEAFDKTARMLGLPYPGGPEISKLAETARSVRSQTSNVWEIKLPRPMMHANNFDFSFSGLKTAVLYTIRDFQKENPAILMNDQFKKALALEFENAAIESLTYKTEKAIKKYGAKTVIVGGGVSANLHLRNEMKKITGKKIKLLLPTRELSTDNALMIGIVGYLNYLKNKKKTPRPASIKANGNLRL